MREKFFGYYRPTEDEFKTLWEKSIFVFDANVLLAPYRLSPEAQNDLINAMKELENRLWLPYQFADEYQRHRIEVIIDQSDAYEDAERTLRKVLTEKFQPKNKHPFVSIEIQRQLESICEHLKVKMSDYRAFLREDMHLDTISNLFQNKVGDPFTREELLAFYKEGKERFDNKVPPGYEDSKKPEPERYGDFIGWQEMLRKAKAAESSMIFVTSDAKEDWWYIAKHDLTIGPRPELIQEFKTHTGQEFYMYTIDQFLENAAKFSGKEISAATIEELKRKLPPEKNADEEKASRLYSMEKAISYQREMPKRSSADIDDKPMMEKDEYE
jgi:hypothetical protein